MQRGLVVPGYGWRHHPAVKMCVGYEEALVRYGLPYVWPPMLTRTVNPSASRPMDT